jgi:hypothetical protein
VYAFALRHASAYNLNDADHPSIVAETFCFAPRAMLLSINRRAEFPTKANPFLCLDGSLGVPELHRVA